MVRRQQTVDLGVGCHLVLLFHQAEPLKFRLDAIFDAVPAVVLDVDATGRDELSCAVVDDGADAGKDGAIGCALVVNDENHGSVGGKMALIGCFYDVLLQATEA